MVITDIPGNEIGEKPLFELGTPDNSFDSIEIGKDKVEALRKMVDDINEMVEDRGVLSGKVISDGEKVKMEISNFLSENRVKDPNDPVETQERSGLRQKKVEISEFQLKEKVACWQDIAMLKRELRERERELSEKEGRLNMLNSILEGE